MAYRSETLGDTQIPTILGELEASELFPIIKNDSPGEPKSTHNEFPDEILDLGLRNLGEWLGLDPFGKIVYGHQQEFPASYHRGKRTHNVHTPLSEGPWST